MGGTCRLAPEKARDLLPETREDWNLDGGTDPEYSGYAGYFRTHSEVIRFAEGTETQRKDAV